MKAYFWTIEQLLANMAKHGWTAGMASLRLRYILPLDRARTRG